MSERFALVLPVSDDFAGDASAVAALERTAVEDWRRQLRQQAPRATVLVGPVTKWLEPATAVIDGETVKLRDERTDPETGETHHVPTHGWLVTGWVRR